MSTNGDPQAQAAFDVGEQHVAAVYAEALLNAAEKRGQADGILEELESLVQDVFRADPNFETFLASPAVGRDHRAEALRRIFEGRADELFLNFLMVLNHHDRLNLLRTILTEARTIRDKRARRIRVLVRSAAPLAEDQQDRLRKELRETFSLEPVLETRLDPDLLGGMVVRVGDWVYDGSVRARLDNLRNQLIERSSHEIQSGRDRFSSNA